MKKIVPDPPHLLVQNPFITAYSDITPEDALHNAYDLMRGVADTIDEHCRLHAGKRGLPTLASASQAVDAALILFQHAIATANAKEDIADD